MFTDSGRDGARRSKEPRPRHNWHYKMDHETYITKHHPDWVPYDGTFEITVRHRD
jgi:hypothetical protein